MKRKDIDQKKEKDIGDVIRETRIRKGISQSELARLCNMKPTQLCNLEANKNIPSLVTIRRIADVLKVSVIDLIADGQRKSKEAAEARIASNRGEINSDFKRVSLEERTEEIDNDTFRELIATMEEYIRLEKKVGVRRTAPFPFYLPFYEKTEEGAEQLAHMVRSRCGIGDAILFDPVNFLENLGVHVFFRPFKNWQKPDAENLTNQALRSISYIDKSTHDLFIFVNEDATPERQTYRLLFEVGSAFIFLSNGGNRPVVYTRANKHFANRFASAFLLPEDVVRTTILQLNIKPGDWNMELLCRIKRRFGISAECFLFRLSELNLIDDTKIDELKEEINAYYQSNNGNEPDPTPRSLEKNARFEELKFLASLKEEASETRFPFH